MKQRPIVIDLFAGCGGMSLGLEAAGFDIAASVEIDPIHCLVHHYNFPYGVTICQDITQLNSQEILRKIERKRFNTEIDLIAGGPPCQGFSLMGKRQLDDPRNKLVFEYLRMIKELKPKYFLFENVPGIANGKHKKFLDELIEAFAENGYRIVQPVKILDASGFGAPQKRQRLIIIGYRYDVPKPKYPIPVYRDFEGKTVQSPLKSLTTVEQALSDLANITIFIEKDQGIDAEKLDYQDFRANYLLKPSQAFALCYPRTYTDKVWGHIGSKHEEKSIQRFRETEPGKTEKVSRFFKLAPDGLSNTLRAGTASDRGAYTAPRPIHYYHPRCISVREAARLHTFPDWFQFHRTIWHGFREIGNAVVPFLAKSLGEEIIKCLDVDPNQYNQRKLNKIDDKILSFDMSEAAKFWKVSENTIPQRKR